MSKEITELVQNAFPPLVAALVSSQAELACQKNNMNFVEMLQPFSNFPSDAYIRDPSGTVLYIRPGLRLTLQYASWEPPAPPVARKWLNEAAGIQPDPDNNLTIDIGNREITIPNDSSWFEAWRSVFLQVQFPSDHEFLKHYLACIIVVSSEEPDPASSVQSLWSACVSKGGTGSNQLPKWFFSPALQYHVLLHDASSETADFSKAEQQIAKMRAQFGDSYCTLLVINTQNEPEENSVDPWTQYISSKTNQERIQQYEQPEEAQEAAEESLQAHPLSPVAPSSPGMPPLSKPKTGPRGIWLSAEDREKIRLLIPEFTSKVLLPYAEKQIHTLTELVIARKGLSRSLVSATKRWFGSGSKPGTGASSPQASPQTASYTADSAERGLRRLGDLSFLLGLPQLSFPAYHALKRDLAADQAWLMLAGALEMAALSAFLQIDQPPTSAKRAQEYMEEAVNTYLNLCRLPQFATRAALLSAEILKSRGLMLEAAQQLIRLTSEDSDLRSALLLEQAAYCFLNINRIPKSFRKYGFHMVLAGHRYNKAGQRAHALRCYLQALQIYEGRNWGLAEDHILFTVGRQSAFLRQLNAAKDAFSKLLSAGSRQSALQQSTFLKEFLQTLQGIQELKENKGIDVLPVPTIDCQNIQTLLGTLQAPSPASSIITGTGFNKYDPEEVSCWEKLEEKLLSELMGAPPMLFKPTVQLFSQYTNNTFRPQAIVNEPVTVQMTVHNPLHLPLTLKNVKLLWRFTSLDNTEQYCNEIAEPTGVMDTQVLANLTLDSSIRLQVSLSLIPRQLGEIEIYAYAFDLCGPINAEQTPTSVPGKVLLSVRGARLKKKEDGYAPDYRLTISVKPPMPLLQAKFDGADSKLYCGETRKLGLWLRNGGPQPLKNLSLIISPSDVLCLNLPLGSRPPQLPFTVLTKLQQADQQGHRVGSLGVDDSASLVKVKLPNGQLNPGEESALQLWIKAPMTRGSLRLALLMYYEGEEPSRYRLLRHTWRVSVTNAVQLTAQIMRSVKIIPSVESLNLSLQVSHQSPIELDNEEETLLSILQVSLVCRDWYLGAQCITPTESSLRPQESSHMLLKILRSSEPVKERLYSHTTLVKHTPISSWPSLQFLAKESPNDSDQFKFSVVVRWRIQRGTEMREGNHLVTLNQLGTPVTMPQYGDIPPPPTPVALVTPELAIAQKLVSHRLEHATSLQHDFAQIRLCVVPVQLLLQNCSDFVLDVTVNTNDNPSVLKITQLYSPHASAGLCFLGPSCRRITLSPRESTAVGLKAAFPCPGTYDLSRRLLVSCRKSNSQESTVQTWHCPSIFVLSQS